MDTQQLVELGKQMNLEGEKLCEYVRAEQAIARDERMRISLEKKEARMADIEDEERIAAKAEKERIAEKEEAERIRQHEKDILRIQAESDRIRSQETSMSREINDSAYRPRNYGRSPKLPVFCDGKDDMDAYLQRFERYAENEGWEDGCYGTYLGTLLSGKALEVYSRLPASEAKDYSKLKEALLIHYQLTQEDYRKKFHSGTQTSMETASQYLARLEHFFDNWIRLSRIEESFEELRELILVEKFLHSCPRELALFIRERSPRDKKQLLELAKVFTSARAAVGGSNKTQQSNRDAEVRPNNQPLSNRSNNESHWNQDTGKGLCYLCRQPGHRAISCPTGRPRRYDDKMRPPMQGHAACLMNEIDCDSIPIIGGGCSLERENLPLMKGWMGDQEITVLRDTGCTGVMIRAELVNPSQYTGSNQRLMSITSRMEEFPVAWIQIDTPVFVGSVHALCLPNPICDLIIGNIPGVHPEILGSSGRYLVQEGNQELTKVKAYENDLDTREDLDINKDDDRMKSTQDMLAKEEKEVIGGAVQTREGRSREVHPLKPLLIHGNLEYQQCSPKQFKEAQTQDPSLDRFFEWAKEPFQGNNSQNKWFEMDGDLLVRRYKRPEDGVFLRQVLVPKKLRDEVLRLGHDGILAGHLGIKKSGDRIITNFYWPGIMGDIRRYCQSCDICQRTVDKGSVRRAPVQSVPWVHIPFDKVAIDLIGPLHPVTNRGKRYILTVVDYATRYPEAVPLEKIDTESIAEALIGIFSRVGFPREILSDNGAQFVSQVMKEVTRLISVKQLFSSPYHPMANGLCEKFNGTLKKMLIRMSNEQPKEWDRFIEPLLFAYREVPQESTGFSPFELLYGRTLRGPMSILRDLWTKEGIDNEVITTYQYVFDLRNRIEDTCNVARENLLTAQRKYKKHFDKSARLRTLDIGERALVILPTDHNKLLLRWKGPYQVVEKIGVCDYRIKIGNHNRLFHINMLKKYIDREPILCAVAAILDPMDCPELEINEMPEIGKETYLDVPISDELTEGPARDIKRLLEEYEEIFSDIPGLTYLEEHLITLNTDAPVRRKSYPVPFSKVTEIENEVKKMMSMGIVEPSKSPYCSPLLLVKKSDGSLRPVVDYRLLNRATIFDAEPMPNPEEIYAKLNKGKYFSTFDFCKGYWQIPMNLEDKEKTAFSSTLGLFQFVRMPFGLINAGATYERMMRKLLNGMTGVANYVDDVIVYSTTWEEHMVSLRELFNRVKEASLTMKPSKCNVAYSQVNFVGHKVGAGQLTTQMDKVERVMNAEIPRNKTQVRSLLGLVGYYRKFIDNFASLTAPLSDLTKNGKPDIVQWNDDLQERFEKIKTQLCNAPVLKLPDFDKDFVLRTDASDTGLGAVLLQKHGETMFPTVYASKKLTGASKSYATVEKECMAIVWAIDKFSVYLYGRAFTLQTDHQPLMYLNSAKLTNPRLMRWALKLQPYRFRIEAIPGVDNVGADWLSRSV